MLSLNLPVHVEPIMRQLSDDVGTAMFESCCAMHVPCHAKLCRAVRALACYGVLCYALLRCAMLCCAALCYWLMSYLGSLLFNVMDQGSIIGTSV